MCSKAILRASLTEVHHAVVTTAKRSRALTAALTATHVFRIECRMLHAAVLYVWFGDMMGHVEPACAHHRVP